MDALLWVFLPPVVAAAGALLAFVIMQARLEAAVLKERQALAAAQAMIEAQKVQMDERVAATEEATRRKALDEFMQDFRVEERSYVRDVKSMFSARRLMVVQERLFFRNIPLSNWVEHEMLLEEGADPERLVRPGSVFSSAGVGDGAARRSGGRLLAQNPGPHGPA